MQLEKPQEIKVYKMTPIYLTDTWTHRNIYKDNDLKKQEYFPRPGQSKGLKKWVNDFGK